MCPPAPPHQSPPDAIQGDLCFEDDGGYSPPKCKTFCRNGMESPQIYCPLSRDLASILEFCP